MQLESGQGEVEKIHVIVERKAAVENLLAKVSNQMEKKKLRAELFSLQKAEKNFFKGVYSH